MPRPLAYALALVLVVVAAAACPDPCVFGGNGCNVDSDCADGRVCRLKREGEGGCFVVRGTCVDAECGSVKGCGEDECCDPETNSCIAAFLYTGPVCDELTCGDCGATQVKDACRSDEDCGSDQICEVDFGSSNQGVCFALCEDDDDCGLDERCFVGHCTYRIGTPCDLDGLDGIEDRCGGLSCIDLDASGDRTDPYCTAYCSDAQLDDGTRRSCPPGFVCNDDALECRRL